MILNKKSIEKYIEVKEALVYYKRVEAELRAEICNEISAGVLGSTKTFIKGFDLVSNYGLNYKLDAAGLDKIKLSKAELACVQLKPSLDKKAYNELPELERVNLDSLVTITPAMPTLKIVEGES